MGTPPRLDRSGNVERKRRFSLSPHSDNCNVHFYSSERSDAALSLLGDGGGSGVIGTTKPLGAGTIAGVGAAGCEMKVGSLAVPIFSSSFFASSSTAAVFIFITVISVKQKIPTSLYCFQESGMYFSMSNAACASNIP